MLIGSMVITSNVSAEVNTMTQDDKGYGYSFDDDPLHSGGFGPKDQLIRVRKKAARATLIRPRTSFVYELIKSVEDL